MLRYRLLTFDVNNTLIRVRNSVGDQYRNVAKQFGVNIKASDINREFRIQYKDQLRRHPNFGVTTNQTTEQWWDEVVHHTFHAAGCNCDKGILGSISSKLFDDFKTSQAWETYPEVKEMLTFLNRNGIALGVLSNNDERLLSTLKAVDIADHFAFILPSTIAKCEKPDAEFFNMALERLDIEPGLSAHIGDNVNLDYRAARTVGMDAYLVDREGTLLENHPEINPDHLLSDISDLEPLIFMK
ncbi:haloacid dehalogenase-like hydrolase domain-containing protein 3 [Lytechinus pictus]|uniref:haloacid dehalogenase-like hydrolase domain-containing protein 3 n=1 Tax=Lytechinus pictus TaxID=7653 RepID=UPI0030B9D242